MKKLLWAALLPLAFTACTNEEDFVSVESPELNGSFITLDKNFALGLTKEGVEENSRAQYVGGMSLHWNPALDGSSNPIFDKVGLSWTGQAPNGQVFTNYEFELYAWSVKDQTPDIDECTNKWDNLVYMTKGDHDAQGNPLTCDYVTTWALNANNIVEGTQNGTKIPNTQAGYFKTKNLTIFGGNYIVYAPFNTEFKDAGYLMAKTKSSFERPAAVKVDPSDPATINKVLLEAANEMFYAGAANITGGTSANGFNMEAVSGLIQLRINRDKDATQTWDFVEKIVIVGEDGVVVEQAIDASKVAEADAQNDMSKCLVAGTEVSEPSLMVTLSTNMLVNNEELQTLMIPALPQTIKNAKIYLISTNGRTAEYTYGDIIVKSNKPVQVNVSLTDANAYQTEHYVAVDMKTLALAMGQAGISGSENATIELLKDIEYDKNYTNALDGFVEVVNNLTITGNSLIIPAGQYLELYIHNFSSSVKGNLTVDSELIIEEACCGNTKAEVLVYGESSLDNSITFNQAVTNDGKLTIGKNSKPTVATFVGDVENNDELVIKALANVDFADIINNGTVNMLKDSNKGQLVSMDNLDNNGEFTVGKYTQLSIDETLVNDGNITIETASSGVEGEDGTIYINEDAIATNNGKIYNRGVFNNLGTTTGEAGSEFVDYVGSQSISYAPITIKEGAEYISEVNTSESERLGYALNDNVPTTTVRFVQDGALKHEYQMGDYKSYAKMKTVKYIVNVAPTTIFRFMNNAGKLTVGEKLTVESAQNVVFNGNTTTINGDVIVKAGQMSNKGDAGYLAKVIVKGNLTLENAAKLKVNALGGNIVATQATTPSFTVEKDVTLNGTAQMEVLSGAATDFNANLNIAEHTTATFNYSSYSDIYNKITIRGTFNRVLSSGSQTANPAMVWCGSYDTASGIIPNGGPQKRK